MAYLGCIMYASRHLTDGHIPDGRAASRIADDAGTDRRVFTKLVQAGLLEPCNDGGWTVVDYLDWQPSRAYVEHQRARNRDKVRAHRERGKANRLLHQGTDEGSNSLRSRSKTKSSSRLGSPTRDPRANGATGLASTPAAQDQPAPTELLEDGSSAGRVTSAEGASIPDVASREVSTSQRSGSSESPQPLGDDVRRFLERLRGGAA